MKLYQRSSSCHDECSPSKCVLQNTIKNHWHFGCLFSPSIELLDWASNVLNTFYVSNRSIWLSEIVWFLSGTIQDHVVCQVFSAHSLPHYLY